MALPEAVTAVTDPLSNVQQYFNWIHIACIFGMTRKHACALSAQMDCFAVACRVSIAGCGALWLAKDAMYRYAFPHSAVWLVEYECFQPPQRNRVTIEQFRRMQRKMGCYTDESLAFMDKMIERTGNLSISQSIYRSDSLLH